MLCRALEKTPGTEGMGGAWALGGKGGVGGIWDKGRDLEEGKDAQMDTWLGSWDRTGGWGRRGKRMSQVWDKGPGSVGTSCIPSCPAPAITPLAQDFSSLASPRLRSRSLPVPQSRRPWSRSPRARVTHRVLQQVPTGNFRRPGVHPHQLNSLGSWVLSGPGKCRA